MLRSFHGLLLLLATVLHGASASELTPSPVCSLVDSCEAVPVASPVTARVTLSVIDDFEHVAGLAVQRLLPASDSVRAAPLAFSDGAAPLRQHHTARLPEPAFTLLTHGEMVMPVLGQTMATQDGTVAAQAAAGDKPRLLRRHINLSGHQITARTLADLLAHLRASADVDVLNLSLGMEAQTAAGLFAPLMRDFAGLWRGGDAPVLTVAAGNGGGSCEGQDFRGCNLIAVALAAHSATRESTLVVGALSDCNGSQSLARESARAGRLAHRFVAACGAMAQSPWSGTSFAAARVAALAAALKQNHPGLSSVDIASIILASASKDIDGDGIDDFAGVSPVHGHGRIWPERAMQMATDWPTR